jgi:hypothetical protein
MIHCDNCGLPIDDCICEPNSIEEIFILTRSEAVSLKELLQKEYIDANHYPEAYKVIQKIFTFVG